MSRDGNDKIEERLKKLERQNEAIVTKRIADKARNYAFSWISVILLALSIVGVTKFYDILKKFEDRVLARAPKYAESIVEKRVESAIKAQIDTTIANQIDRELTTAVNQIDRELVTAAAPKDQVFVYTATFFQGQRETALVEAKKLQERLTDLKLNYISSVYERADKTRWAVVVGETKTKNEANLLINTLKVHGIDAWPNLAKNWKKIFPSN